jgi:hypothetical protein
VGADIERRRPAVGDRAVVDEGGLDQLVERAERRARRDRVGGVGGDQQRRAVWDSLGTIP